MRHTLISEEQAAEMLDFKPRTLRQKVLAQGRYKNQEPLPITYNAASRSLRYSKEDIEKYLRATTYRRAM